MAEDKSHSQITQDLAGFVAKACPGIEVEVGHSDRWQRTCLTFRWEGFHGLLLEERFRLLAKQVPADYFETYCRNAVWLELAPGESIDEFLAQPRSEDVEGRLNSIWQTLRDCNFFAALEDELVRVPAHQCPDDLRHSKRVLAAKNLSAEQVRDACLAFMGHQAYADWEVLRQVRPIVEKKRKKRG